MSTFFQIAAGDFPPGYTVSRGGRLRAPPRAWRGRITRNYPPKNGVSLQQLDRIAPAFQGEDQPAEKWDQHGRPAESDTTGNPESHECTVCLEDIEGSEMKRMLPCQHLYHSHCIESWAVKNNACPNCRRKIFDADAEQSSQSPTGSVNTSTSPQGTAMANSTGGRPVRSTANGSFVTARLDTISMQANSRFWISPRARDNMPVLGNCGTDHSSPSLGSLRMTFATAREPLCSPARTRPSPKIFSGAQTECATGASEP